LVIEKNNVLEREEEVGRCGEEIAESIHAVSILYNM
jgi:hypothetical protein